MVNLEANSRVKTQVAVVNPRHSTLNWKEIAIHVKSLMKESRVDRSMMGRHAPEPYGTTKQGQTAIPEEPPRGSGDFLWGVKRVQEEGLRDLRRSRSRRRLSASPGCRRQSEVPTPSRSRRRGWSRLRTSREEYIPGRMSSSIKRGRRK